MLQISHDLFSCKVRSTLSRHDRQSIAQCLLRPLPSTAFHATDPGGCRPRTMPKCTSRPQSPHTTYARVAWIDSVNTKLCAEAEEWRNCAMYACSALLLGILIQIAKCDPQAKGFHVRLLCVRRHKNNIISGSRDEVARIYWSHNSRLRYLHVSKKMFARSLWLMDLCLQVKLYSLDTRIQPNSPCITHVCMWSYD